MILKAFNSFVNYVSIGQSMKTWKENMRLYQATWPNTWQEEEEEEEEEEEDILCDILGTLTNSM